jgi:streptogramin lyase
MRRAALLALVLVAACGASAGDPVSVRLPGRPGAVVAGSAWPATLSVTPAAAGRPVLAARAGGTTCTFATTAAGRGRWRARVVLPTPGRWALSARLRGRSYPLGAVVAPPPADLVEPFSVIGNGSEGFAGDGGPARAALVSHPHGVAAERDGSLIVADSWNNRVRRIEPGGTVATIPGGEVLQPIDVVVGPDGSLYVAGDNRIRRIGRDGGVRIVAGTGARVSSGDGGPAARAA